MRIDEKTASEPMSRLEGNPNYGRTHRQRATKIEDDDLVVRIRTRSRAVNFGILMMGGSAPPVRACAREGGREDDAE
jgi:hypothetical protein